MLARINWLYSCDRSFFKQGNRIQTDLASFCTSTNETTSNCEVKLDEEDKGSTLELDNVSESNFGEYVCQLEEGNVIMNKTFSVQDKGMLTRKFTLNSITFK